MKISINDGCVHLTDLDNEHRDAALRTLRAEYPTADLDDAGVADVPKWEESGDRRQWLVVGVPLDHAPRVRDMLELAAASIRDEAARRAGHDVAECGRGDG